MRPTSVLISKAFVREFGELLASAAREAGLVLAYVHLSDHPHEPLAEADRARIEVAFLSRDWRFGPQFTSFCEAVQSAPRLSWLHFASAGIDQHPFLPALISRDVRLTSSAGSNGVPVAETAICGLLMLARGFPRWVEAQRRHMWAPVRGGESPPDLGGQTVVIVGLGTIGATVARFCQSVGMRVVGIRRSPKSPGDPVDEMRTVEELDAVLPRANWLVLACPRTRETHHLVNARTLAQMPPGAHVVNVARGGVVDEAALIDALRSGHIAGAYLDVFEKEPLPAESPLWTLPNVIVTPHDASVAAGNVKRVAQIFARNLVEWARGAPLENERHA